MSDKEKAKKEDKVEEAPAPSAPVADAPAAEAPKPENMQERAGAFVKEYGELVQKHGIDFASYPVWVPDGQGGFKVVVQNTPVDVRNQPKKSPFVAQ